MFFVVACFLTVSSCEKVGRHRNPKINVVVTSEDTKSAYTNTHGLEVLGGFMMTVFVDEDYSDFTVDPPEEVGEAGVYIEPVNANTPNVHFHTGSWTIDNNKEWVANVTTRFLCHAPAVLPHAGSCTPATRSDVTYGWGEDGHEKEISFSYEMADAGQTNPISGFCYDADNCADLIFAYADKVYDGSSPTISLKFNHALSRVTFVVSPDDGTFDNTLTIKSIAINAVPSSGDCVFDGGETAVGDKFTWTNLGTKKNYAQSYDASFLERPDGWTLGHYSKNSTSYTTYTADNSFFFIPHTLSGAQITIVFVDSGQEISRTVSLPNDTWKAGYVYKYKIGATVLSRTILVNVTLDDWINYDDKLII